MSLTDPLVLWEVTGRQKDGRRGRGTEETLFCMHY